MNLYKQTVALRDVKCFALHGFYPEEQLIGNHFIVNLETVFMPQNFEDELSDTVNYEVLNSIIREEMQQTQKLLETVLHRMITKVISCYPFVESVHVSIQKLNPPMPGQIGHSYVQLSYNANPES